MAGLLVTLLMIAAGCSSDDTASGADGSASARPTTSSAPPSTTTLPLVRDHAVGERTIQLVDPSRPTAADPARGIPGRPERTIPVLLVYPAKGAAVGTATGVVDAEIADGPFPLVVFSHGFTARGDTYAPRLRPWAQAGYVVAAPTYPLTSGPGASLGDYVHQPRDVLFVIDELLAAADDETDPLHDRLDGDVAVAGHSLGAATTIGVAFNSCCRDDRIDAAIAMSGIELPIPEGTFDDRLPVPLLAVHGARDTTLSIDFTEALLDRTAPPTYYLRFPEGGHSDVLAGPSGELVDAAVIAFLDRYLKDDPRRLEALPDLVEASGAATLIVHTE